MDNPETFVEPPTPTVETNGFDTKSQRENATLKRRRTIEDVDGSDSFNGHHARISVPKSSPRASTPDPHHPQNREMDIHVYDDKSNDDYEWIRLPKHREYDLFRVARYKPEDRNKAALPLIATRHADGQEVTMWAKMDTGADLNLMNRSTLEALLGDDTDRLVQSNTFGEAKEFETMGHGSFETMKHVKLDFTAGSSKRSFRNVRFEIVPDEWEDSNGDGVPNVILSYQFLRENSMMMMDFEYHCDADPALPVIAQRAEDENPSPRQARILVTKYPQRPGMVKIKR